ncbi:hypothetical protein BT69DRAFT_478357 [Atractiella rhizophila]|nr:hypothetical protein BT69DRAFT_478357 [Atractiella rhizophila]
MAQVKSWIKEELDLSKFSSSNASQVCDSSTVPIKAVFRGAIVGLRYLASHNPPIFNRFQLKFKTPAQAALFVQAISVWCPCRSSEGQEPAATQEAQSQRIPPEPETQRSQNLHPQTTRADAFDQETPSSGNSSAATGGLTLAEMLERDKRILLLSQRQLQNRASPSAPSSQWVPVPAVRPTSCSNDSDEPPAKKRKHSAAGTALTSHSDRASLGGGGVGQLETFPVVEKALKQKTMGALYGMDEAAFKRLVFEIIMDDGFEELLDRTSKMLPKS